jgi:hypothetical protein
MSIKKCNDLNENRTRDLPACSIVAEPTTLPRAAYKFMLYICTYIMRLAGHVERMERRGMHKEFLGKPEGNRPLR